MAQKVQVLLLDDIDGGRADETVKFALDGQAYEIDLSQAHANELREALAKYVDVARRMGRYNVGGAQRSTTRGSVSRRIAADREQNKAIREWASAKGLKVSPRGRIPQEIVDEYHATAGK
ncbi:histone-like nucleoid-structuring protein Lsr2 [Natronoglycomyces albus]|uniref:Lsr2 family protein n=1 Tax=Natronoglycomyces albus TaxID=2811108 RepID=A0A895XIP3_9ACTN|nr:Lsr2 family protein [Natronoglycomyces albus]QSB05671.1 Lsr2 family protein [Natronoglycomyces albus]